MILHVCGFVHVHSSWVAGAQPMGAGHPGNTSMALATGWTAANLGAGSYDSISCEPLRQAHTCPALAGGSTSDLALEQEGLESQFVMYDDAAGLTDGKPWHLGTAGS